MLKRDLFYIEHQGFTTTQFHDDIYGEDIKAFVVLKPGEKATAEEIMECCSERLKRFKTPREVQFMDALPKSLVGKVLRRELRNPGWNG